MAELLERAVTVREVSVRFSAEADVRNVTTSVPAGLSKDSGSIHLIHTIKNHEQHNNIPYKRLKRWNWISSRSHHMSLAHFPSNDL